ncbi:MAG TPA: helix-turn-helix domain-containing protein [Ruminiclostridium sp.]
MDVMTAYEVAEALKVNYETVLKMIKIGRLKAIKVGSTYRITRNNYISFLEGKK